MGRDRRHVVGGQSSAESRQLTGWGRSSAPGRGVVGEDLDRGGPDGPRSVGGLDHALPEREVDTDATASEGRQGVLGHRADGIGHGSGSATADVDGRRAQPI